MASVLCPVRRTRKGRATHILLHLCCSLLALLVILSISELFVASREGCRWANGLRLYFILVSLMWNGTEAVNMYLLLIRVLNSHVSRFMLKASVTCWGMHPLSYLRSKVTLFHFLLTSAHIWCHLIIYRTFRIYQRYIS